MNINILLYTSGIIFAVTCTVLEYLRSLSTSFFNSPKIKLPSYDRYKSILVSLSNAFLSGIITKILYVYMLDISFIHNNEFILYDILKLFGMLFLSDMSFYWTHRFLHIPFVYKYVHKMHHEHKYPISWSAFYLHPIEFLLTYFCIFLAPVLFFRIHMITFFLYINIITLSLIKSHCGINIYGIYTSIHHDIHHEKFNVNYGTDFGLFDRLCRTKY